MSGPGDVMNVSAHVNTASDSSATSTSTAASIPGHGEIRRPSLIGAAINELITAAANPTNESSNGTASATNATPRPRGLSISAAAVGMPMSNVHSVSAATTAGISTPVLPVTDSSTPHANTRGLAINHELETTIGGITSFSLLSTPSSALSSSSSGRANVASTAAARSLTTNLHPSPITPASSVVFDPSVATYLTQIPDYSSVASAPSTGAINSAAAASSTSVTSPAPVPPVNSSTTQRIRATIRASIRRATEERSARVIEEQKKEWTTIMAKWNEYQLSGLHGLAPNGSHSTAASSMTITQREFHANQKKLSKLIFAHGIPGHLRATVWMMIIGNGLQISSKLFEDLRKESQANRAIYEKWRQQMNQDYDRASKHALRLNTAASSSFGSEPPPDPPSPQSQTLEPHLSLFAVIDQDLPRTFPELAFFHKDGPYEAPLRTVLECTALYRIKQSHGELDGFKLNSSTTGNHSSDASTTAASSTSSSPSSPSTQIGYVQGMSFLASILLLALGDDEFLCFLALTNLLENPQERLSELFSMDATKTQNYLSQFTKQMELSLPALEKYFLRTIHLTPDMFIFKWIFSVYSQSLQLDTCFRLWDYFLWESFKTRGQIAKLHKSSFSALVHDGITFNSSSSTVITSSSSTHGSGFPFLFRVALGILSMYQDSLLQCSFEDCLYFLQHLPGKPGSSGTSANPISTDESLDIDQLFQHIHDIKLDEKIWSKPKPNLHSPPHQPIKSPTSPIRSSTGDSIGSSPDFTGQGSP